MPKMTIEDMKAMMPKRPAELDHLNMFAGDWTFEGKAEFAGLDEPLEMTGTNSAHWDGNNWYLVSTGIFKMADFDDMHGIETWTYDTNSKCYRSSWFDSMGTAGYGRSWYNEDDKTWTMKATSYGPHGKSYMKGKVTFTDENTAEWSMTERAMGGLIKVAEMSGTSKRK
jgi:hypothetical protein